jgi:hypothetical protein
MGISIGFSKGDWGIIRDALAEAKSNYEKDGSWITSGSIRHILNQIDKAISSAEE